MTPCKFVQERLYRLSKLLSIVLRSTRTCLQQITLSHTHLNLSEQVTGDLIGLLGDLNFLHYERTAGCIAAVWQS
jgi:hypothetical protein